MARIRLPYACPQRGYQFKVADTIIIAYERGNMDSFEIVCEYSNYVEAELAKGILTSNGIKAYIHSDDCGGMAGGQTYITGVQLLVSKRDMDKAKMILKL